MQKLIYEQYLYVLSHYSNEFSPTTSFQKYMESFAEIYQDTKSQSGEMLGKVLVSHCDSGFPNYQIGKDFYKALQKCSKTTDISKVPSKLCFHQDEATYQISIPDSTVSYLVSFIGDPDDIFNICIFKFDILPTLKGLKDDFRYWRMVGKKDMSCQSMLDIFIRDNAITDSDISKSELETEIAEIFPLLVNLMLYINSGNPDLRHMKGHSSKGVDFTNPSKRKGKLKKYMETSFHDSILVGFSFKKETFVNGFFRWQPHGPQNSLRRLQWIDGFPRGKEKCV